MARDNVDTIIERVRRQLASTVRMEINVLGASLNTTDTTVQLAYALAKSVRSGAVLSIGRELLRVISVDELAQECVVLRGWQDSVAEAHDTGTEVLINPRFTRFDIVDALIEEIDSWQPDLFKVTDVEVAVTEDTTAFELAVEYADAIGVIEVRRNWTHNADTGVWPTIEYRLQRGTAAAWSAASASGLIIRIANAIGRAYAGSLLVKVAIPYDTTTIDDETDLIADIGIDRPLLELIELGIKYRLMMADEAGRSARNAQDEPRRNEEVQANQALSLGQSYAQRYERRRAQEVMRFRQRYPLRFW